jgi:hypothetical protein
MLFFENLQSLLLLVGNGGSYVQAEKQSVFWVLKFQLCSVYRVCGICAFYENKSIFELEDDEKVSLMPYRVLETTQYGLVSEKTQLF